MLLVQEADPADRVPESCEHMPSSRLRAGSTSPAQ
jgi:hypothetical protein